MAKASISIAAASSVSPGRSLSRGRHARPNPSTDTCQSSLPNLRYFIAASPVLFRLHPGGSMLAAEADNDKAVGLINPPGDEREVGESRRADSYRGRIEDMPFVVLAHAQLKLGAEIARVVRLQAEEAEYLRLRMIVGFAAAVPFPALAVETPGEIDIEPFQVFTIEPDYLVAVARSHAELCRPHHAIASNDGGVAHTGAVYLRIDRRNHFLDEAVVFG